MTTPSIPATMKAAIRPGWTTFGVEVVDDHPTPSPPKSRNQILVKVHAAALNPADYKWPKLILGAVLGFDLCGTVVALPPKCSNPDLKVGDVVVGTAILGFSGSLAEYAVCHPGKVTKLPDGWTTEEGAALPIALGTAMEAFERAGVTDELKKNPEKAPLSSILVIGASGGCGLIALQLAKGMGIERIIGICSSKNADLCKANGATEIVPYDKKDELDQFLEDNKGKLDMIYDTASYAGGEETYCDNAQVKALLPNKTKPSRYISLSGSMATKVWAVSLGMALSHQHTMIVVGKFLEEQLKLGLELLDKAKMKPFLDTTHEFSRDGVVEAYEKLKSRRTQGKIVFTISKPE